MSTERADKARGFVAAALGTGLTGLGTYLAVALIQPVGVSTLQYLTLDAKHELELDGIAIWLALMFAGAVAVVGCGIVLWKRRYPFAFVTSLVIAPIMYFGSVAIEDAQSDWSGRTGAEGPSLALVLVLWPVVAGWIARAIVFLLLRDRTVRRPGAAFEQPQ